MHRYNSFKVVNAVTMHMVQSPSCCKCNNAQIHLPGLCGVAGVEGVGGGVNVEGVCVGVEVGCTLAIAY